MNSILRTFLWFPSRLGEALDFYQEIFGDAMIVSERNPGPNGEVFTADFSIYGHDFIGLCVEGGPEFNDSISLSISCDGQAETDRGCEVSSFVPGLAPPQLESGNRLCFCSRC